MMGAGLFITGTGTDVGKTYISGLLLKKLHEAGKDAVYYKAAMSGNERGEDGTLIPGDALHVKNVSGISQELGEMCPYVYETAVSPHLAAKLEGSPVELERVVEGYEKLSREHDIVIAEGSGGIVCPIRYDSRKIMLEDIVKAFGLDCIIVADAGLGTINHVVLTNEYLKARGIKVRGIILNNYLDGDMMHRDNKQMCSLLTGLEVLACVRAGEQDIAIDAQKLEAICKGEKE